MSSTKSDNTATSAPSPTLPAASSTTDESALSDHDPTALGIGTCFGLAFGSAVSGGVMGGLFGMGAGLFKRQGFKTVLSEGWQSCKTFALMSGVHSLVTGSLKLVRHKDDVINQAVAGCATGLALGWGGTPAAMLQNCAGFAAFAFIAEGISPSSRSSDTAQAATLPLSLPRAQSLHHTPSLSRPHSHSEPTMVSPTGGSPFSPAVDTAAARVAAAVLFTPLALGVSSARMKALPARVSSPSVPVVRVSPTSQTRGHKNVEPNVGQVEYQSAGSMVACPAACMHIGLPVYLSEPLPLSQSARATA